MTTYILPLNSDVPWYRFKISLDSVVYTLRLRFNSRMDRWIFDIADSSNNDILLGLPLLIQRDLFGQYILSGLPNGMLIVTDDTEQDEQPTRNSFGTDKTLNYLSLL